MVHINLSQLFNSLTIQLTISQISIKQQQKCSFSLLHCLFYIQVTAYLLFKTGSKILADNDIKIPPSHF